MGNALTIQIALRIPIGVRIAEGASGGGQKATKRSQKDSKWNPNGSQMGAKRRPKWSQKEQREPKGHPLRNKNEKVTKRVRRSMQIDAKRVPRWSQKRCKNTLKINSKTGTEKIIKIMEKLPFENVKPSKFVGRVIEFQGFARCVREREFIENLLKN
jgi:hypothetical protein